MSPVIHIGSIEILSFPCCVGLGVLICLLIYIFQYDTFSLKYKSFFKSIIYTTFPVLICGKALFYFASYDVVKDIKPFILRMFSLGFVFYGGFTGLLIGLFVYSRIKKINYFDCSDTYLRLLPIGQAFGRIGCLFNGCCYGFETTKWYSIHIKNDLVDVSAFPIQIVESICCFILGVFLNTKKIKQGNYTIIYILVYSILRFFIEFFRGDSLRGFIGILSVSQIISIFYINIALIMLSILKKDFKNKQLFTKFKL